MVGATGTTASSDDATVRVTDAVGACESRTLKRPGVPPSSRVRVAGVTTISSSPLASGSPPTASTPASTALGESIAAPSAAGALSPHAAPKATTPRTITNERNLSRMLPSLPVVAVPSSDTTVIDPRTPLTVERRSDSRRFARRLARKILSRIAQIPCIQRQGEVGDPPRNADTNGLSKSRRIRADALPRATGAVDHSKWITGAIRMVAPGSTIETRALPGVPGCTRVTR